MQKALKKVKLSPKKKRELKRRVLRVNIFFVNDAKIRKLKEAYFGVRRTTDVISFPLLEEGLLGEIVISLDTAVRQAKRRGLPLKYELILLAVHGLWHLQGLPDEKMADWKKMRIAEFETVVKIL